MLCPVITQRNAAGTAVGAAVVPVAYLGRVTVPLHTARSRSSGDGSTSWLCGVPISMQTIQAHHR